MSATTDLAPPATTDLAPPATTDLAPPATTVRSRRSSPADRRRGAPPRSEDREPTVAFVASLAVGLASAGWTADRAVPELVAAADGAPAVLNRARARLRTRASAADPGTRRAVQLLRRAEMATALAVR